MIDYDVIHQRVESFLQTREGLNKPQIPKNFEVFVDEVTGILCAASFRLHLTTKDVVTFLDIVEVHKIRGVKEAQFVEVEHLINDKIKQHPLYFPLEYHLMYYKPGRTQTGPGEFFMCFYSADSIFGVNNFWGFDVHVDKHNTELKTVDSQKTGGPQKLDEYEEDDRVDRLMVLAPISNALKPRVRSRYVNVTFEKTNWRDILTHTGPQDTLVIRNR